MRIARLLATALLAASFTVAAFESKAGIGIDVVPLLLPRFWEYHYDGLEYGAGSTLYFPIWPAENIRFEPTVGLLVLDGRVMPSVGFAVARVTVATDRFVGYYGVRGGVDPVLLSGSPGVFPFAHVLCGGECIVAGRFAVGIEGILGYRKDTYDKHTVATGIKMLLKTYVF